MPIITTPEIRKHSKLLFYFSQALSPYFLSAGFNLSTQLSSLLKDIRLHWTGWSMKAEDERHKLVIKVIGDVKALKEM